MENRPKSFGVPTPGNGLDALYKRPGFLLRRAQEELRDRETAKLAAILNALPAHIAMLDAQVALMENALVRYTAAGEVQGPVGFRHPLSTPFKTTMPPSCTGISISLFVATS